jgi:DNA-binding HxlR family transcriptional regulator
MIFFDKKYNSDFAESEEKIATNILAERLARLKKDGLIKRSRDKENGRKIIYTPTPKMLDLIPMMIEIIEWSAKYDPNTRVTKKQEDILKRDKAGFAKSLRSKFER